MAEAAFAPPPAKRMHGYGKSAESSANRGLCECLGPCSRKCPKADLADLWSGSLLFLQGQLASSILIYALFVLGRFSGERLGKDRTCLLHINMAGTGIDKRSISKRRLLGLALP